MAQVPYNGGIADAQPDARPPDDTQRIEANPSSFGGAIAQGAEKAGAGAVDLSKFWGRVQSQDASNNAEKEASDLLVHAKSLEGQDALDAKQTIFKNLDAIRDKYRNQLATPEAQSQYDGTVTPYFNRFIRGNLDTHFVDQKKVVANKVNTDSFGNAISMATMAGSDGSSDPASPTYWVKNAEVARAKAFMAAKADAVQRGLWNQPDVQQSVSQKANAAYMSAIEARALTKPDEAWDRLQDPKVKAQLGSDYDKTFKSVQDTVAKSYISKLDTLAVDAPAKAEAFVRANEAKFGPMFGSALERAHKAASDAIGKGSGNASWDAAASGPPNVSNASATGAPNDYYAITRKLESGGNDNAVSRNPATGAPIAYGRYQFTAGTWRGLGEAHPELGLTGDNILDPQKQELAIRAFTGDNAKILQGQGMAATPANLRMMAFLGAGGGPTFLKEMQANPDAPAAASFGKEAQANPAIFYDKGQPRTMAQVYALMTKAVGGAQVAQGGPLPTTTAHSANASEQPDATDLAAAPETLETTKPTDASFTPPPPAALTPPAPPQTPEDVVNAIYDRQSAAMQHLQKMGLTPEQMIEGERQITQRAAFEIAAAGKQQRAIAAREKEATDDVLGTARKDGYTAAYSKLNALMADPRRPLSEKAFDTLSDVLERRSGNPNPISFGSKYTEALKSIVEPKSETDRISDPRDILKMEADGELTEKGANHLLDRIERMKKSTSELGMQKR